MTPISALPGISPRAAWLAGVVPFRRIDSAWIKNAAAESSEVSLRRWEVLFSEGDRTASLWTVHAGRILLLKDGPNSLPVCVRDALPGNLLCLPPGMGGAAQYPYTAVAAEPTSLLRVPNSRLRFQQKDCAAVAVDAVRLASVWEKEAAERLSLMRETTIVRVAAYLRKRRLAAKAPVRVTRRELALQTGGSIESVFRALRILRREGWVRDRNSAFEVAVKRDLRGLVKAA